MMQPCWSTSVLRCPMCCSPAEPLGQLAASRRDNAPILIWRVRGRTHTFPLGSGHSDTPWGDSDDDATRRRGRTAKRTMPQHLVNRHCRNSAGMFAYRPRVRHRSRRGRSHGRSHRSHAIRGGGAIKSCSGPGGS
jgi:hypothetical protein